MKTKATMTMVIALVMALMVGAVSAQDNPDNDRGRPRVDMIRELTQIVTEATGLTRQEIREQVNEDTTLADVITANGGNVDDVVAQAVAVITERVNEAQANGDIPEDSAVQILENLEQQVTDFVNGEGYLPGGGRPDGERGGRPRVDMMIRELTQIVTEATAD
ncbi:MAG: hypothetical protein Q9P01_00715 [Anaerolineae bacterium]|nr:hypothetical protein [Anaerolineae bacterium]